MPNPALESVHVNRPLTNISVAYIQQASQFVASRVFPVVPVAKRSDSYFIYSKGDWFRSDAQKRAPGTESAGSGYRLTTATYSCDVYAIHKDVDDQIRENSDSPLNPDRDATQYVTHQLLLKRELEWASTFFTTGVWTGSSSSTDITPGTKWDDAASTPIEDVRKEVVAITEKTGYRPNVFVMGPEVWKALVDHPDVLDRVKYTQRDVPTEALLAQLFGVDRVLTAWATRNTAQEQAADSMDFVFGKNALLVYAAPNPSLMTPSGGYIFAWTGYTGAGPEGNRISRFRMDHLRSDRIEGEMAFDMKVVASDVGCFFSAAVA